MRAGVPVELHVIPGAFHGFGVIGLTPQLQMLVGLRRDAFARAFAGAHDRPDQMSLEMLRSMSLRMKGGQ